MTGLTISRRPAVGDPVSADLFNDAFDDIEGGLSSLDSGNLARNAGILRTQLADRFHAFTLGPFCVVPLSSGSDLASPAAYNIPDADTEFFQLEVSLPAGAEAYLCEVQVYVAAGNATNIPRIGIFKNGALIAGTTVSLNSATPVTYRAPEAATVDPFASPFMALRDGDEITVELGKASGGGTATARGVFITLFCKGDLTR